MTVFVTKYASSRGILKAEILEIISSYVAVRFYDGTAAIVNSSEIFATLEEAVQTQISIKKPPIHVISLFR